MRKGFLAALAAAGVLLSFGVAAAPAHVQSAQEDSTVSGTTHDLAFAGAVTPGNRLLAFCRENGGGVTITGIADSVNGAYTELASSPKQISGGTLDVAGFTFASTAAGTPTVTVTLSGASTCRIIIAEYSDAATIVDTDGASLTSADPQTCASSTATGDDQLLIAVNATNGNSQAPNNGETERQEVTTRLQLQDKAVTAGSVASSWNLSAAQEGACLQLVVASAAADGEFDTTPAVASQTTAAYTVDGSLDAAGTVDAVACPKDQTAPTIAQVQAGDCTGDVAAKATDTESPSTGNFDFSLSLAPSDSPDFPLYDLYVTDGTNLTTLADEYLDAPATCGENSDEQCQFAPITSIGADSPCEEFNLLANPDIASPDHLVAPVTTDEGLPLSISAACQFNYSGSQDRQAVLNVAIYDVSAEGYHLEDIDAWFNNAQPVCADDYSRNLRVDVAFSRDINLDCEDEDDVTLAITATGSFPTGISHSDPTTSGTPTVLGESEVATYTATDEPGDTDDLEVTHVVIEQSRGGTGTRLRGLRMRGL